MSQMLPAAVLALGSYLFLSLAPALLFKYTEDGDRETLRDGIEEVKIMRKTQSAARKFSNFFSLTISELLLNHEYQIGSRFYRKEKYLGNKLSDVTDLIYEEGNTLLKEENLLEACEKFKLAFAIDHDVEKINRWAEIISQKGVQFFRTQDFAEASKYFETASTLCTNEDKKKLYLEQQNNAQSEILHQNGLEIFNNANGDLNQCRIAEHSLVQAFNMCSKDYSERHTKFRQSILSVKKTIQKLEDKENARTLIEEGKALFQDACLVESDPANDDLSLARMLFKQSFKKFENASHLVQNNVDCNNWKAAVKAKLNANEYFNTSQRLFIRGDELYSHGQYEEAQTMLETAKLFSCKATDEFQLGLESVNENKFSLWKSMASELCEYICRRINNVFQSICINVEQNINNAVGYDDSFDNTIHFHN